MKMSEGRSQVQWLPEWKEFLIKKWQIGYSRQEIADFMVKEFNVRFTHNQVAGMLNTLKRILGDDVVNGKRLGR